MGAEDMLAKIKSLESQLLTQGQRSATYLKHATTIENEFSAHALRTQAFFDANLGMQLAANDQKSNERHAVAIDQLRTLFDRELSALKKENDKVTTQRDMVKKLLATSEIKRVGATEDVEVLIDAMGIQEEALEACCMLKPHHVVFERVFKGNPHRNSHTNAMQAEKWYLKNADKKIKLREEELELLASELRGYAEALEKAKKDSNWCWCSSHTLTQFVPKL